MTLVPVTLNLNGTADIPTGNMGYVDFDQSASFVDITGSGLIDITDFQADFGATVTTTSPTLELSVFIGGKWLSATVPYDEITYTVGGLVDTLKYVLNYPNGSISALKGKIF